MIEELVRGWNSDWKFDYIYRHKYKLPFNSPEHRVLSPIDVKFDFLEEKLMERERDQYIKREKDLKDYKLTGKWLNKTKMTKKAQADEDDLFGSINTDDLK